MGIRNIIPFAHQMTGHQHAARTHCYEDAVEIWTTLLGDKDDELNDDCVDICEMKVGK